MEVKCRRRSTRASTGARHGGKPKKDRHDASALVSILFLLDLLEEFLLGLTLDAEFRERHCL